MFYVIFAVMNNEKVNQLLKEHQVVSTPIRQEVLQLFISNDSALSNQDLEEQLHDSFNRITLYRTLKTFIEQGIIHRIDVDQKSFYALCSNCKSHQHEDNHVHFKCELCDNIECLYDAGQVQLNLPKSYQIQKINIVVEGICKSCK